MKIKKVIGTIALGTWELTFEDGVKGLIVVTNQSQAKFIRKNMDNLRIKEWKALADAN